MTPEEMFKRLKAGEDPLDLSIEKWVDIVEHLNKITRFEEYNWRLELGSFNCALCQIYSRYICNGCPIKKASGHSGCNETPHRSFHKAWLTKNLESMRKAAIAELEFLKSLKEQKD